MSMLTIKAITEQLEAALGRAVTYEQGVALCIAGDPRPRRSFSDQGAALGLMLAMIANLGDVPMIVLGGEGVSLMGAVETPWRTPCVSIGTRVRARWSSLPLRPTTWSGAAARQSSPSSSSSSGV